MFHVKPSRALAGSAGFESLIHRFSQVGGRGVWLGVDPVTVGGASPQAREKCLFLRILPIVE